MPPRLGEHGRFKVAMTSEQIRTPDAGFVSRSIIQDEIHSWSANILNIKTAIDSATSGWNTEPIVTDIDDKRNENKEICMDKILENMLAEVAKKKADAVKAELTVLEYTPKLILYNDPATIVFWKDGTKTIVKRRECEEFNPYTAFVCALAKKILGNNSRITKIVNGGIFQEKKTIKKEKPIVIDPTDPLYHT